MASYEISRVRNSFCRNANNLLIGKVQGKGTLTTVMDMLLKNLGATSKLQATGERCVDPSGRTV